MKEPLNNVKDNSVSGVANLDASEELTDVNEPLILSLICAELLTTPVGNCARTTSSDGNSDLT